MDTIQTTHWRVLHRHSEQTVKIYSTLAGARIAQRQRNRNLGLIKRVERVIEDHREWEVCVNCQGEEIIGTWCIEELTVDQITLAQWEVVDDE